MSSTDRIGRSHAAVLFAAFVLLIFGSIGLANGTSQARRGPSDPPAATMTVEPLPGLGLDLSITTIEETARGGIVSLRLVTTSTVRVEELTLAMRLPPQVVFTDGSREKSWQMDLLAGGRSAHSVDLLIDRPGRFHLSAEAIGTFEGKTIRRGTGLQVAVGGGDRHPEVRSGAIQYRGRTRSHERQR